MSSISSTSLSPRIHSLLSLLVAPLFPSTQRRMSSSTRIAAISHLLFLYTAYNLLRSTWRWERSRGFRGMGEDIYRSIQSVVISILLRLPSSKRKIKEEMGEAREQLETKLVPLTLPDGAQYFRSLPSEGKSKEWVEQEMTRYKSMEKNDVEEGKVSGAVYHGAEELNEIINKAMAMFVLSNPLHPDVFPGVRKMEAEVVSFCLNLFQNPKGAGTTTSGGTESILMAVKTYRDWARHTKGIRHPEMVIPSSAHAAFWKAANYFKIKLHVIPVNEVTRRADVKRMARAINGDTIMIVGSAPNFPDGAVDDIPALAKVAGRHAIGLHVDCCLGSFLMPFLRRMTIEDAQGNRVPAVPDFDFSVDGVTSISCDTHKYGFCPKGSSVIMYRDTNLRKYQYYVQPDWAGGVYASPSMAGSRPGSVIAGAWAVMTHIGEDGYAKSCEQICGAAGNLKKRIKSDFIDELYVLGDPLVSVVAFGSRTLNIYAIGDRMSKRGWHLSALANPAALHMAVTMPVSRSIDKLIEDLRFVVDEVKADKSTEGKGDLVALYGLGQTSVGPQLVTELATMFIDTLYLTR